MHLYIGNRPTPRHLPSRTDFAKALAEAEAATDAMIAAVERTRAAHPSGRLDGAAIRAGVREGQRRARRDHEADRALRDVDLAAALRDAFPA